MGILRIGGGISGIVDYLVHGRKQGQEMSRDELDERVVLHGDLDITGAVVEGMTVAGQKYLHITFSVKERDLSKEKFREIDEFIREKITAAYEPGEINVYSELQRPKIKNVVNKTTGEWHERLDHIHYVIPQKNLVTGKKENPVGFFDHNIEYFEAIQELANIKFGLASPKDNARVDISHSDVVARVKEVDTFTKGNFKDLKDEIINDILAKEIKDYAAFQEHLKSIGTVKITNAGKENEYLGVKPFGKDKFVNLRETEFRKDFFELPESDRAQTLGAGHAEKRSSRMRPKRTEAEYEATVKEWVGRRSKEVRYLNSGSKVYKKYFAATKEEKAEILAYYETRAKAQRLKLEKQHDDKYREHGRSSGHQRSAVARDQSRAGERIFAERAEQEALARIMGGDRKPGLAVSTLREAPRFGDRVHGLSQGNVAGEQRSAPLLVQSDAHHDVEAGRRIAAGDELQRAGGRLGVGRVNPATGRTADTATAQLLRDEQEAMRQEAGDRQPTIKEIKSHLDAKRLLADLAKTHLLRPEEYVISEGADGDARIRHSGGHHGSLQKYNVSDFLTKHLHMSWSEAQPYLAASYGRQKNAVPVQAVANKARPDLWAEFQAARRAEAVADPDKAKKDWESQRKSELERRSAINDHHKKVKASIAADPRLSVAQRKAQKSVAQMNKVEEQRILGLKIQRERANLRRISSTGEQYRLWLQEKAQGGDVEALAELRAQNTGPARQPAAMDRVIAAADKDRNDGTLGEQPEPAWLRLRYRVAENGDVTYVKDRKELLVDAGRRLYVLDQGDESVERALQLAATKWGGKMELKGTSEFIRQAVEVAARKNMGIEFVDQEQNAALLAAKEGMRKGMERTDRFRENAKAHAPGQAQTNGQEEEILSPTKRATRQQQQRAQARDADREEDRDRDIDAP